MFLVELGSGKDELYPSTQALRMAIRRGDLGPQARIYHRATSRWLPITVHPEFRRAEAERDRASALGFQRRQWTFVRDAPGTSLAPEPPAAMPPVFLPGPAPSWLQTVGSTFRRLWHRRSQ